MSSHYTQVLPILDIFEKSFWALQKKQIHPSSIPPSPSIFTAKRQSHHSPSLIQTPQCKGRIQYVISLSSLMVLPTLNAHATRPKISLDQSILHGKKQEEAVFCLNFLPRFAM